MTVWKEVEVALDKRWWCNKLEALGISWQDLEKEAEVRKRRRRRKTWRRRRRRKLRRRKRSKARSSHFFNSYSLWSTIMMNSTVFYGKTDIFIFTRWPQYKNASWWDASNGIGGVFYCKTMGSSSNLNPLNNFSDVDLMYHEVLWRLSQIWPQIWCMPKNPMTKWSLYCTITQKCGGCTSKLHFRNFGRVSSLLTSTWELMRNKYWKYFVIADNLCTAILHHDCGSGRHWIGG